MTAAPPAAHTAAELPVHLTRFVGRGRELDDLVRLLGGTRMLTLTGAGGSGKTRLAREVAARVADAFTRVAWVDLTALPQAELLGEHLVAALHVPERAGATPLQLLVGALEPDRVLVVLDNCEHLVDSCAVLADALLRACPRVVILATSREALGVASETAWLVPPLARTEAVQLFVERAQATLPSFALTPANAATLGEICRRLDGIPLAIELAAARVRVLSPEQIASRLDDAFRLLTGGSRTALPRHRTLRATMEWSVALLGAREQQLLQRLGVFAGSFTLEAAETVCTGGALEPEDILDGVSALVDKSLVCMEPGDGVARYRLLETVRQYGREQLADTGELDEFEERHARFFLALVEEIAPDIVGGANAPGLIERLEAEHDNIRAAAAWAASDPSRAEIALRYVGALFWFWYAVGQFRESRQMADRALALHADAPALVRGRAFLASGLTALAQGEYALSIAHFDSALSMLRAVGDDEGVAVALAKGGAAQMLGGDPRALATLDESIAFTRAWPEGHIGAIFARYWRGWAAYLRGDLELAHAMMSTNTRVARERGLTVSLGHSLSMLARIEIARGEVEAACAAVIESLEIETGNEDDWGIVEALDVVAIAAARRGRYEDAIRLLAAIHSHRERLAMALPGLAPADRERLEADARAVLGARYDECYAEGAAMPTSQVMALAFAEAARNTVEHHVVRSEPRAHDAGATRPRLRVAALGPLQVSVGGQQVEASAWGSARPRELLVYLLLHPEGRTKEQVGLAFWPDASAAQLRNNFHVTLHRLRKALGGAEWVTLAGERYRIDPALIEEFDAHAFEAEVTEARRALKRQQEGAAAWLEQALTRYRGELLDGEPVGDWHLEHRDRLQRLYVDAMMTLGARLTAEERHAKAAEVYRRVLARDELHEEALQALMRAHAALGERAQALRAYQRFAERLREELDVEPDGETTRLFERLQVAAAV